MPLIWVEKETEYFCKHIWTGQITLKPLQKIAFTRNAIDDTKRSLELRSNIRQQLARIACAAPQLGQISFQTTAEKLRERIRE